MKFNISLPTIFILAILLTGCHAHQHSHEHSTSEIHKHNQDNSDISGTWVITAKDEVIIDSNIDNCITDTDMSTVFFISQTDGSFKIIEGRDVGVMPELEGVVENNIYTISNQFKGEISGEMFFAEASTRLFLNDLKMLEGTYEWKWSEAGKYCQASGKLFGRKITDLPPHLNTDSTRKKVILHRRIVHSYQ